MKPVLVLGCCAALLLGCRRGNESFCPAPAIEIDPETIPDGDNQTDVTVTVTNKKPDPSREVVTELYADSGTFGDPFALETTYTCAYDVVGEVELCVDAAYGPPNQSDRGSSTELIGAALDYIRAPHAYFVRPEDCLETDCATVVCPEEKNACPEISALTVEPEIVAEGETATVTVTADDPDDNPAPLVTTLQASAGSFADRFAAETTYACDPEVGGTIEICVLASDGDDSCDVSLCVTAQCPGPLPDNVCPVIRDLTATPIEIPPNERQSLIEVDAVDPDEKPGPLMTKLSASAGTFEDRDAATTLFTCGAPGPTEICVEVSDGDRPCNKERCITVQCPSTVPDNFCPKLYVLNALPSTIPAGETSTEIQVRAEDNDDGPLPLTTTLYSSRGIFDNVNAENTVYHCERSGLNEICVDATDGACVKTRCTDVICP
jgi:hypothetical protein